MIGSAAYTPAKAAAPTAAFDISDSELRDSAEKAALSVKRLADLWQTQGTPEPTVRRTLRRIAAKHHVRLPDKDGLNHALNRLSDPAWWRRALRQRFRLVELQAIRSGQVHRHASPYVSPKAARRAARDRQRIEELLASLEVVNQNTGEVLSLEEIAAQSLANPANRRRAMMARLKGIEDYSKAKGHEALFLTITCPSRMHARHHSGAPNERYDGTGPRQAQAYMNSVWRRATRKLQHVGIVFYGVRVTEPHHDACPHWHLLAFTPSKHASQLVSVLRSYALMDCPDEPGATERRFKVETIDAEKGSAVGYVAKYVAKSLDGEGVGDDDETGGSAVEAACSIVAWARVWGMRQFQFFGLPHITPTRELYRLDQLTAPSRGLELAHQACKANDYGAWLTACEAHGLRFRVDYSERPSTRYPDEIARRIRGVTALAGDLEQALQLITRTDEWRIQPRASHRTTAADSPPWTRFNNCAHVDSIDVFGAADAHTPAGGDAGRQRQQRRGSTCEESATSRARRPASSPPAVVDLEEAPC